MNERRIASELLKLARELLSMEFDTKEEMEQYKRDHEVRPGTKLTVKSEGRGTKKKGPKDDNDDNEDVYKSELRKNEYRQEDLLEMIESNGAIDGIKPLYVKGVKNFSSPRMIYPIGDAKAWKSLKHVSVSSHKLDSGGVKVVVRRHFPEKDGSTRTYTEKKFFFDGTTTHSDAVRQVQRVTDSAVRTLKRSID